MAKARRPGMKKWAIEVQPHRKEFGIYLRDLIEKTGYSITEFAQEIGVHESLLGHVIRGACALPAAMITGETRVVNGKPGLNRASRRPVICLANKFNFTDAERTEFVERAWMAQSPKEVADIIGRYRGKTEKAVAPQPHKANRRLAIIAGDVGYKVHSYILAPSLTMQQASWLRAMEAAEQLLDKIREDQPPGAEA